jgi:WD40 repeat protein
MVSPSLHPRPLVSLAVVFWLASVTSFACAADEPALAELPETPPVIVESRALEFARKEFAKLDARVEASRVAVEAAAAKVASVDKNDANAVKAANEGKAAADKELAAIEAKAAAVETRVELLGRAMPKADPMAVKDVAAFKHTRPLHSVRVDPTGEFLFAGAQDNQLQQWDLAFGTQKLVPGHRTWIRGMNFDAGGQLLISGDYTGKVIWWNPHDAEMKPLREIQAHKGYARSVSISPDRQFVATSGNDNMVRIWSVVDGSLVKELAGHARHVYNVAFDPTGKHLVSGDLMGVLKQWNVATWNLVRDLDGKILTTFDKTFVADCGGIRGIDFSADGKTLVVSGISEVSNAFAGIGKPTAVAFNMDSGERQKVMLPKDNFDGTLWGVRYDPAGQFIVGVGGGGSGGMWFWKPGEDKSFHFVKMPAVAYDVSFHPDGLRLAVAFYDNTIRLYDMGPSPAPKPAEKSPPRGRRRR